jgi:hypothetical protein
VSSQPYVVSPCVPCPNTPTEFSNVWETPYDTVDSTAFQCKKDRGTGDISTSMFLINHFLDTEVFGNPVPYVAKANVTNAASGPGSLGEEVTVCAGLYNRYPNFLLVDVCLPSIRPVALLTEGFISITSTVEAPCSKLPQLPTASLTPGPCRLQDLRARADRRPSQRPRQQALDVGARVVE